MNQEYAEFCEKLVEQVGGRKDEYVENGVREALEAQRKWFLDHMPLPQTGDDKTDYNRGEISGYNQAVADCRKILGE